MKKIVIAVVLVSLVCLTAFTFMTSKKPPTGFGAIKFGDKPEQVNGLVEDTSASLFSSYETYTIPDEKLSFGGVELNDVEYNFGPKGFNQATAVVWGDENIDKIEKECRRLWGKPERLEDSSALVWRSENGCAGIMYRMRTLENGKTEAGAILRIWDESRA